jgi:hypothetical protein
MSFDELEHLLDNMGGLNSEANDEERAGLFSIWLEKFLMEAGEIVSIELSPALASLCSLSTLSPT